MNPLLERFLRSRPTNPESPENCALAWAALAERAARQILGREPDLISRIGEAHGFSEAEARRALRGALGQIEHAALMRIWRAELKSGIESPARPGGIMNSLTVIFGGGAIPQPTVQALVAAGMVSRRVFYRPSSSDPILAPYLVQVMDEIAASDRVSFPAELLPKTFCATWPHDDGTLTKAILNHADTLVIFGDEETVADISALAPASSQKFIYGPRLSFSVLDLDHLPSMQSLGKIVAAHAEDVVAYDQRGCLSPTTLYLVGGEAKLRRDVCATLHTSLLNIARRQGFTPRLPPSASSAIHSLRAIYLMDGSGKRAIYTSGGLPGWTLLYDEVDLSLRDSPGYQTLFVVPVKSWDALPGAVEPNPKIPPRLQGMAVGPDPSVCPRSVLTALRKRGLSRVCAPGELQSPPLDWTHDGNPFFPLKLTSDPSKSMERS